MPHTGQSYATPGMINDQRTAALDSWLTHYNTARSHSALGGRPPDQPGRHVNDLTGHNG